MSNVQFNFHEVLLGLTSVVANADGKNRDSEIEARVNMILNEEISTSTIDVFKSKYDELNSLDLTYQTCLDKLQKCSKEEQAKAAAYMWLVANVGTKDTDEEVDLSHLEEVENWKNSSQYVDLEELVWINKLKKDLGLKVEDMKYAFANLPEAKRITG